MRRNHSHSNYNIGYTLKTEKAGGNSSTISSRPSFIPLRIHVAPSLVFLGRDLAARGRISVQEGTYFPGCFLSPPPSASLASWALCCECQGCQCHSLTCLEFLTFHQEADRAGERGEATGIRLHSPVQKSGEKGSPTSSLWHALMTGQLIHHAGFFSYTQLVCFPTPIEIPKVWLYSVSSKAGAPITDETEFVIQQVPRLWSVAIGTLWEDSTSPFRGLIRCTLSL